MTSLLALADQLAGGHARSLRDDGPTSRELEVAKEHLKGSLMLSLESTSSRMSNLARQEIYFGRQLGEERWFVNVGRAVVPLIDVTSADGNLIPGLVAIPYSPVLLVEHIRGQRFGRCLADFLAAGPDFAEEGHVLQPETHQKELKYLASSNRRLQKYQ